MFSLLYYDNEGNEQFRSQPNEPVLQQKDSLWENIPFLNVISTLKEGDSVFFQLSLDQKDRKIKFYLMKHLQILKKSLKMLLAEMKKIILKLNILISKSKMDQF